MMDIYVLEGARPTCDPTRPGGQIREADWVEAA